MALTINTNMTSLSAIQGMNTNSQALSKTFQRLISGSRINNAGDDPAGFSISTRMTAQIQGSNIAVQNAQDAVSATQVADSAMKETMSALQQMHDLVVSAGGAGVSASDRTNIANEVNGLIQEIQRIATSTTFNNKQLLTGSYLQKIQVGANQGQFMQVQISAVSAGAIGMSYAAAASLKPFDSTITTALSVNLSQDLQAITNAMNKVSNIRANLGSVQNRLNDTITGLNSLVSATTDARSRITDTDYASEAANLAQEQIKQQVGASILAQANQSSVSILTLLKG
ncbi:MAG: flagellin FliC [Magnetococcales bacterium]|nr:flagellin FliC [Magnetococcales bacterium]